MFKKLISQIVLISFLAFLVTPTIIVIVDESIHVSVFTDIAKENESEKNIEIEGFFNDFNDKEIDFTSNLNKRKSSYFFKKYSKPHLNLISPPPDFLS